MKIRRIGRALAIFTILSVPVFAQTAAPLLVDVEWLSQHLKDRDLVILHVEDKRGYDAEHIPGARYIEMGNVADQAGRNGLTLELPAVEDLRAKVAAFGIADDSRIVVYVGSDGALQSATRIILSLDYLGLGDRTSLLNGGMAAWKRAEKPVSSTVPSVTPGKLSARPAKNVVVDAEFVKSLAQRPNHKLVDARAAVFYQGIQPTAAGAAGHIPGAVSIPFTQVSDDRQLIDRERVAALFRDAGVRPGDTVVVYCHIGQQATAVVFGARLLGHSVMLYDGSFQDWATNKRGPVEK
jgi:thiosulfate/3-mercaptopyruvate sulfurtransferase